MTNKTNIVTCSIGSGQGDIQFLFAEDILGDAPGPFPRHSKQYEDLYSMRVKMQEMRIQAFKAYIQEVNNQNFPSKEFEVSVEDSVKTELIEYISKQY